MEAPKSSVAPTPSNPLLSFSTFIHQHSLRLGAELASRLEDTKRLTSKLAANFPSFPSPPTPPPPPPSHSSSPLLLPFASLSQSQSPPRPAPAAAASTTLSSDYVAKTLAGTSVYTVSNSNNEFVLISDPNGAKSIGLLCFRREDAEAFLAQVIMFFIERVVF